MGVKSSDADVEHPALSIDGGQRVKPKAMPSHASPRVGALQPRYALALNPHQNARFSTCPRCGVPNRVRKIPLVIHVERAGLLVLRKSCRLCTSCEMIIVHQDELEPLISASIPPAGAVGKRRGYLRGLAQDSSRVATAADS